MQDIRKQLEVELCSQEDVLQCFTNAFRIQELHPKDSELIARAVFDYTHPSRLSFELDNDISKLRDEFGALEAPGLPEDNSDPIVYRDRLWQRLKNLVNESRTA